MTAIPAARSDILALRSYKPGAQIEDTIRLNANEAPVSSGAGALNRYPEVHPFRLRDRLAELLAAEPANVLVTRGSSESIDVLIRSWCRAYEDEILVTPPTFEMYRVYADIQGVRVVEAPLTRPDFGLDPGTVLAACSDRTKLIFICSPNNPTGTLVPERDILQLADERLGRSLVVVDEAYIEFSGRASLAAAVDGRPNLVVLRTLSKAHALAGARCGVTIADTHVIGVMARVLPPYSFPTPVIERVAEALRPGNTARSAAAVGDAIAERGRLQERLDALDCVVRTWPSSANFILTRFAELKPVLRHLMQSRILIREFGDVPALDNCARITVGAREENDALLDALSRYEGKSDG